MKTARIASLLAAIAALVAIPASAQAQVTFGELAPGSNPAPQCSGPKDLVPFKPTFPYASPNSGVLTSWSTNAGGMPGQQVTFKVMRPFAGEAYVVGHDGPRTLIPGSINTFQISIPVQEGDLLAVSHASGAVESACIFTVSNAADEVEEAQASYADGQTVHKEKSLSGFRLNLQAALLEAPKILSLSANHGSVTGGTPVTISGRNLARIKNVTFDEIPAKVTENPDGTLTAIAPPHPSLNDATVIVRTIVGTDTSTTFFKYEGCAVPNVVKKRLSEAKRRLLAGGCALGKVKKLRGHKSKKGPKVIKQSPKAGGAPLAPGTKVNLTVK